MTRSRLNIDAFERRGGSLAFAGRAFLATGSLFFLLSTSPLPAAESAREGAQVAKKSAEKKSSAAQPTASEAAHAYSLPFIEDDVARARKEALERNVPMFIDFWAPWCHTCISMKNYVFTDPALKPLSGDFVWLMVDVEKEVNAPFLEKFRPEALPTLMVFDPKTESAALKWLGSATVPQLTKLLDDGKRAIAQGGADAAETNLARADKLNAEGKASEAAAAYRDALKVATPDWPRRARTLESLVGALSQSGDAQACARVAQEEAPKMARDLSFASVASTGLGCSLGESWGAEARTVLEPLTLEALKLDGMLADDRSSMYELLVEARHEAGDDAGAKQRAGEWISYLEAEAAKAKTPAARAVFDAHRLNAALALGDPGRAVGALEQSEKDLPQDYNPPARLAVAYRELGRLDDALKANDRALKLVYGPRKIRVLEVRASIYEKKGDKASARKTLEEALAFARSLPKGQDSARTVARLEQAILATNP